MRTLLLLLLFCAWHAGAAATTPARLTEGPDSIESHLRIPQGVLYTAPQRFNEVIWHGNHDPLESSNILL